MGLRRLGLEFLLLRVTDEGRRELSLDFPLSFRLALDVVEWLPPEVSLSRALSLRFLSTKILMPFTIIKEGSSSSFSSAISGLSASSLFPAGFFSALVRRVVILARVLETENLSFRAGGLPISGGSLSVGVVGMMRRW